MHVDQIEVLEGIARRAAVAWSERLDVRVTPDMIVLGALLAVPPERQPAVEALAAHLRDEE